MSVATNEKKYFLISFLNVIIATTVWKISWQQQHFKNGNENSKPD